MKALLVICLWLSLPLASHGQDRSPILVELFATENCRACPKAYETLRAIEGERDDVLVITWPVDYWDYLGKDESMALEASKERQSAYVERFGLRGPYTPQTVYDGRLQCPGNKRKQVVKALNDAQREDGSSARLRADGEKIILTGKVTTLMEIVLVEFLDDANNPTDMPRPVVSATSVAPWVGGRVELERSICPSTCALLVQGVDYGEVLAAMKIGN